MPSQHAKTPIFRPIRAFLGVAIVVIAVVVVVVTSLGNRAMASVKRSKTAAETAAKPTSKTAKTTATKSTSAVVAAPPTLHALLDQFRRSPGLQARFVEAKHMALLAAPLRSEGTLYYLAPGHLARHIHKPSRSIVLIEPQQVRILDAGVWQRIDLTTRPVVRRFVDSFVSILRGDEARLHQLYGISYAVVAAKKPPAKNSAAKTNAAKTNTAKKLASPSWRVLLKPKHAPLNKVVKLLELRGAGLVVHRMRMVELDGDETITTFSQVDPARRYTAAEKKRLFFMKSK